MSKMQTFIYSLAAFLALAFGPWAQAEEDLRQSMQASLDEILEAVQLPPAQAVQALADSVDFAYISRGVMGQHGKSASSEQLGAFKDAFALSIVELLNEATKSTGNFTVQVDQVKISSKNAQRGQVQATVKPAQGERIALVASVAESDNNWKVRNLIVDGVNLGLTYRNQFNQLMLEHDSDLDKVIQAWAASPAPTP